MSHLLWRALGFAVPSVGFVTALHLAREWSAGEAVDGIVSGLYFAVMFLLGGILALFVRLAARAPRDEEGAGRGGASECLAGLLAALVAWVLVWLWWELPLTHALRAWPNGVFALNSAAMVIAALGLAALRDRRPASAAPA